MDNMLTGFILCRLALETWTASMQTLKRMRRMIQTV